MSGGAAGSFAEIARLVVIVLLFAGTAYALSRRRRPLAEVPDGPEDEPYRIYTSDFDLELAAADVQTKLPLASPDGRKGYYRNDHALWLGCIPRVEALLAETDEGGWGEAFAAVQSAAEGLVGGGLLVSLLIDQSGSMKGARMAWAAVLATRMTALLERAGARSEILGFTTAGWHGGYAYERWQEHGRPPRPGRLCALMHVVYKEADEDGLAEEARNVMLDPALLRENVDGEALLWAWRRLAARPEPHKILIVISDGAPVDDATLVHNGPSYLYRHLKHTLAMLEDERSLTMGGIGICHDVESFYPLSARVDGPDGLHDAAAAVLETTIAAAGRKTRSIAPP